MGDVISYGGDAVIVATRTEIERVQLQLNQAALVLSNELELVDYISQPLKRVGLAMEFPALQEKLQHLLHACQIANEQYFDGDALIANRVIGANLAPVAAFGLISIAAHAGLLQEHQVIVNSIGTDSAVRSPQTLEQLVSRVITVSHRNSAEIRIEKYPGKFFVYISGTQNWSPIAGKNPFDATSNLNAMVQPAKAASELGVQKALQIAGVQSNDKVVFIGHSQGGLIAANIASQAAKQNYRVAGLVTVGAPIAQLKINVPTISIEHTNDIVPKLALRANPLQTNWVTIQREIPVPDSNSLFHTHSLEGYKETAELADNSNQENIVRLKKEIFGDKAENGFAKKLELQRN